LGRRFGVLYIQTIDNDIYTGVIGIGKYIGSVLVEPQILSTNK
jgi:hypothetical protein